jgi:phage-related minor tail protein
VYEGARDSAGNLYEGAKERASNVYEGVQETADSLRQKAAQMAGMGQDKVDQFIIITCVFNFSSFYFLMSWLYLFL